ncbi:MAG: YdcF family protein, partial [Beijerinckiaceae bacterium]
MFFYLSKIFWAVAAPSGLIGLALAAALLAMAAGRVRAGRNLLVFALAAYAIAGWAPLGQALLRPLEDRFVRPANLPAPPVGILVLGGGIDEVMGAARNTSELTEQGGRMTEAVRLAKLYPDARLLFTGGSAALTGSTVTEAAAARRFFIEQG